MAYRHYGDNIVVTATATSLTALLTTAGQTMPPAPGAGYSTILMRAAAANGGVIYFGPNANITGAGANAGGFLNASDGAGIDLHGGGIAYTDNLYFIGSTAENNLLIDLHEG